MKSFIFQLDPFSEFEICAVFLHHVLSNFWSLWSWVAPGSSLDFFVKEFMGAEMPERSPTKFSPYNLVKDLSHFHKCFYS